MNPRRSAVLVLNAVLVLASWVTLTVAHVQGRLPTRELAASPARIADGQEWLLLTSGLVVQRPVVLSLISFVLLALLVLWMCGPVVMWLVMIAGHVFSTLVAYGLLAVLRAVDPASYAALWQADDYGVSAIAAGWLGVVACSAWSRRGSSARGRAAVVVACAAVGVFALMVERHVQGNLTFLESEHVFAFAFGVLAVARPWRLSLAALRPVRTLKAPATSD